ncbi:MAG: sulfite exporter TauE/SafE family protein [Acidobacteriaceae bacterium]
MPLFSMFHAAWLAIVCFLAGGINAIAGGGSLLSFPALLQIGVLPVHANATNTVALLPGQFTSAAAYRRELQRYRSMVPILLIAALAGGLIGARLLMATRQDTFLRMVPWLLLTATLLFALGSPLQQRLFKETPQAHVTGLRPLARILLPVGIFSVCLYVGFFGAGSGLLIMGVLSFAGIDSVHEINALKTVITSTSNGVAAVTFILYGAVVWRYGVVMMIAASLGGYGSARLARKHKPRGIRAFVVVMGCIVTTYFFWKIYR